MWWPLVLGAVGVALLGAAAARMVRRARRWRAALEDCRARLGGELTPGVGLHPPALWARWPDRALVIRLLGRDDAGGKTSRRLRGHHRAFGVTRLVVEGERQPRGIELRSASMLDGLRRERIALGVPRIDRQLCVTGSPTVALARLGADRRPAVLAAIAQGAWYEDQRWVLERARAVLDPDELVGLARLLLAAADAIQPGESVDNSLLCENVARDPEPAVRLRSLEQLAIRPGPWRDAALRAALDDPEPAIRLQGARGLGLHGLSTLAALATEPGATRLAAIEALGDVDHPDGRALLVTLAGNDDDGEDAVALAAIESLARLDHRDAGLVDALLGHPDAERRRAGLALAIRLQDGESRLLRRIDDASPRVVEAALRALMVVGTAATAARIDGWLAAGGPGPRLEPLARSVFEQTRARDVDDPHGRLDLVEHDQERAGQLGLSGAAGALSIDPVGVADLFDDASEPPTGASGRATPAAARAPETGSTAPGPETG